MVRTGLIKRVRFQQDSKAVRELAELKSGVGDSRERKQLEQNP